jgi:NAD+-dependent protein deacetylase sirtuin 5
VVFNFQGHVAIANYEAKYASEKAITVITQNVDGLHVRAGTKNLIELHGNLYKTRCTKCKEVLENTNSPICEVCIFFLLLLILWV